MEPADGKTGKKAVLQTRRKVVREWGREALGKGGKTFLKKSFSLPSPNPIPPFPKTFDLIESLLSAFPAGKKRCLEGIYGLGAGGRFPCGKKEEPEQCVQALCC